MLPDPSQERDDSTTQCLASISHPCCDAGQQIAETASDHDRMEGMKAFVEGRTADYERKAKPGTP